MDSDRKVKIGLLAATSVLLLLTVVFNYLSTAEFGRNGWLFINNSLPWSQRGNIKDSGLTPPRFAFIVWAVIYVYQAAMLGYCWSLAFRKAAGDSEQHMYLCSVPGLLPSAALALHSIGSVCNVAWTFLADRADGTPGLIVPQTFAIFGIFATLAGAIGVSYRGLLVAWRAGLDRREFILSAGLWINSNGFYCGWVAVASFLNVDIAIINLSGWTVGESGMLCLAHIIVLVMVVSALDLCWLRLDLLYSPYLTCVWALVTSAGRNWNPAGATTVLSIETAIAIVGVLVAKFVLTFLRKGLGYGSVQPALDPQDEVAMQEVVEPKPPKY